MTAIVSTPAARPRPNLISGALAGALGIAGIIHCLLMPDHFAASTIFGLGFLAAAVGQIGLAALVLLRPRTWVYAAVIGAGVVLMGLYAFNVAVGLPFHAAHAGQSIVAAADDHGHIDDHGTNDDHGTDDHADASHGNEGLAIGAGEPVDPLGATTQVAQLTAIGLATVLIRRRPSLAP